MVATRHLKMLILVKINSAFGGINYRNILNISRGAFQRSCYSRGTSPLSNRGARLDGGKVNWQGHPDLTELSECLPLWGHPPPKACSY